MKLHHSDELFAEIYEELLYSMERTIYDVYSSHKSLIDLEVIIIFDCLIQDYRKLEMGSEAPKVHHFAEPMHSLYSSLRFLCNTLLEKCTMVFERSEQSETKPLDISEVIGCLMKLRSSARVWNKLNGRQGYLEFIGNYL